MKTVKIIFKRVFSMKLFRTRSKVLIPLIGAFLSLASLVIASWLISQHFSQRVYNVLENNSDNSEKMHIITNLIEVTHFRTRLTGQMLVTKDIFERDEISQKLDKYATRFALLRLKLYELPLNDNEMYILNMQTELIKKILPTQREAVDLAMTDSEASLEKAQNLLYKVVIPGQVNISNFFMQILNILRDDIKNSSTTAIKTQKKASNVNLGLIALFTLTTIFVAPITIRRILTIESGFNSTNQELTRLNNVKTEFISLVSHELRTPLTSIKSFAEILMDDIEDMDVKTQKRYLSIINNESDRLTRLVTNILDLQKIDANKMEWRDENIILNDIAQKSVDTFSGAYHAKNITLSIATAPENLSVIADSDKLKQVFANLLSNALKFTEEGEVMVSIYQHQAKTANDSYRDMALVSVSDTGPGIPEDQRLQIFDSFHQIDNSATRKTGGSGLGLDICRKIINHYEGNIWVENNQDKGSVFFFEIPLVKATTKKIGDTLIELGMITDDQLEIALKTQSE